MMNAQTIDICICTFQRVSLNRTLASIASQILPSNIAVRVIVADNDVLDTKRAEIEGIFTTLKINGRYVHAPCQNISIARNACIDAATGDWIVFIDDDEEAPPDWVSTLYSVGIDYDIVFGVSRAIFIDPAIPLWVVEGDFHSNKRNGNDAEWNGYTANVIIRRTFLINHGLRFRESFGQTGGEDTAIFLEAFDAGARFGYAPEAVVTEETPRSRATFRWLARRRFRAGQTHYILFKGRARAVAFLAILKAAACLALLPTTVGRPLAWRRSVLRMIFHTGVATSPLGISPYLEYGSGRSSPPTQRAMPL